MRCLITGRGSLEVLWSLHGSNYLKTNWTQPWAICSRCLWLSWTGWSPLPLSSTLCFCAFVNNLWEFVFMWRVIFEQNNCLKLLRSFRSKEVSSMRSFVALPTLLQLVVPSKFNMYLDKTSVKSYSRLMIPWSSHICLCIHFDYHFCPMVHEKALEVRVLMLGILWGILSCPLRKLTNK